MVEGACCRRRRAAIARYRRSPAGPSLASHTLLLLRLHSHPPHPPPFQTYVDFMSRFTGRDKEEVRRDVGRNRYFTPDQVRLIDMHWRCRSRCRCCDLHCLCRRLCRCCWCCCCSSRCRCCCWMLLFLLQCGASAAAVASHCCCCCCAPLPGCCCCSRTLAHSPSRAQAVEYGIIDKVMQPSDAVVVSRAATTGGVRGRRRSSAGLPACLPARPCLRFDHACNTASHLVRSCLTPSTSPGLRLAPTQIERRDYEGMLRQSQSQGRGARSGGGAMAGADA